MAGRILLVEDDPGIATVIVTALGDEGFDVDCVDSIASRDARLADTSYSVMLTDVVLVDGDGLASLGAVRERHPAMPVIVLSAQNTLDTAVRATELSAFEYFPKPFDLDELLRAVRQAVERGEGRVRAGEEPAEGLPMVGRSQAMQGVYRMITRVLRNDLTVLILGESGTGKEVVARAIHELSARSAGPFVPINCGAIPAELLESELFGHEKGAFTGAHKSYPGKFEQAQGSSLRVYPAVAGLPPDHELAQVAQGLSQVVDHESVVVREELIAHVGHFPTRQIAVQPVDEGAVVADDVGHGGKQMPRLHHHIDRLLGVAEHGDAGVAGKALGTPLELP